MQFEWNGHCLSEKMLLRLEFMCLQARILTISPEMEDYARQVAQEMKKAGIRTEVMSGA